MLCSNTGARADVGWLKWLPLPVRSEMPRTLLPTNACTVRPVSVKKCPFGAAALRPKIGLVIVVIAGGETCARLKTLLSIEPRLSGSRTRIL
jgi:hypothetical protein